MGKTDFIRTPTSNRRMTDSDVKITNALVIPVFTSLPTLNGNTDEDGYICMYQGQLMQYTSAGGWVPVGANGVFSTNITVSLSGGKRWLGVYPSGTTVITIGKTVNQVLAEAATEAIPPTVALTSPTSVQFNQTAISNVLNFSYVINTAGASVSTAQLQWRRNNTGAWTTLSSSTTATTFTHTLTDSSFNPAPFNYQYTVTDNEGAIDTQTLDIIPAAYQAASVAFTIGSTTRERADVNTAVAGTITQLSPDVPLTSYQVQYQVNGAGAWNNIGSPITITGSSAAVSVNHNDSSLYGSDSLSYRIQVVDAYQTTNSAPEAVTFIYPYFYGANASNSTSFNIYTTGTKDIASGAGSLLIPFGASAQFPWFAIESTLPPKTAWFVTTLNSGAIGGGANLFATGVSVTVTGTNWSRTYLIYMANNPTTLPTATIS